MLLVSLTALAVGWLGMLAAVVGMCRDAARGDRALRRHAELQTLPLRST